MTFDAMVAAGKITLIEASQIAAVGDEYDVVAAAQQKAVIVDIERHGNEWLGNIGEFSILGISDREQFTAHSVNGGLRFEGGHACDDTRKAVATVIVDVEAIFLTRCGARAHMVPFEGSSVRLQRWWGDMLAAIRGTASHACQLVQVECHIDQLAAVCRGPILARRDLRRPGGRNVRQSATIRRLSRRVIA